MLHLLKCSELHGSPLAAVCWALDVVCFPRVPLVSAALALVCTAKWQQGDTFRWTK